MSILLHPLPVHEKQSVVSQTVDAEDRCFASTLKEYFGPVAGVCDDSGHQLGVCKTGRPEGDEERCVHPWSNTIRSGPEADRERGIPRDPGASEGVRNAAGVLEFEGFL